MSHRQEYEEGRRTTIDDEFADAVLGRASSPENLLPNRTIALRDNNTTENHCWRFLVIRLMVLEITYPFDSAMRTDGVSLPDAEIARVTICRRLFTSEIALTVPPAPAETL
jgi:hypothetical protein